MTPLRAVLSAALRGTGPFAEICAFPLTNPRPELVEVATPIVLDAAEGEKRLDDVPSVSQTGVLRNECEPNNYSFKSGRAHARATRAGDSRSRRGKNLTEFASRRAALPHAETCPQFVSEARREQIGN